MSMTAHILLPLLALAAPGVALAGEAAPPVRLEIHSRETAFGGESFGEHGQYEKIVATAHMRIDPLAEENREIVDLDHAPRAVDGMVEYDVDVVILRPREAAKARRVLLYEVVNRGMRLLTMMTGGSFNPDAPGDGLIMRQGFTIVASGWQSDVGGNGLLGTRFPVATRGDKPLTDTASMETIFDDLTGNRMDLPYPAASLTQEGAQLTVRALVDDPPTVIPATHWRFEDDRHIAIDRPAGMDAGAIYRFTYNARDPVPMGLGFAATRDLISWLRHASAADGNPLADISAAPCERDAESECANPEGGVFSSAIAFGVSQSAGYLRDFLWQGFNRDLADRRVFDGILPLVAGARETFTNVRFAQPSRFLHQHEDHDVPGFTFPFAYSTLTDPVTGKRDGIMQACSGSDTCPKLFHVDTSSEFWVAGASLVGTGGTDHDVDFPDNVRAYMIAGGPHAPGMTSPMCQYPANPLNYTPVVRALLLAMADWTTGRSEPPASRWPRLDRGELVPRQDLHAPEIASLGLKWPNVVSTPVPPEGKSGWPVFVPKVDGDGNDLPGIHLPDIAAPDGTYLGWNLRKAGFGEGDLCLVFGSHLPFAKDETARGDDPRPSLAERYPQPNAKAERFRAAVDALNREGFLLDEDADKLRAEAGGD